MNDRLVENISDERIENGFILASRISSGNQTLKRCAFFHDLSAILVFIDLKENAMNPRPLLHLEGAAVLIVSLLSYHWSRGSWLQFALLFLLPDLSMIGYVANIRVGAITYNALHTYVGPLVLAGYAFGSNRAAIVSLSLIWIAHIGLDRMLGFGLKYPTRFNDTHLNPDRHTLSIGN
jgi:Domain of unknown function (DUF4260)